MDKIIGKLVLSSSKDEGVGNPKEPEAEEGGKFNKVLVVSDFFKLLAGIVLFYPMAVVFCRGDMAKRAINISGNFSGANAYSG